MNAVDDITKRLKAKSEIEYKQMRRRSDQRLLSVNISDRS